ncbi:MAG: hypothetical protein ABSH05_01670 [Bryobacteraceae bacterium]|jgi:hypothetical protein
MSASTSYRKRTPQRAWLWIVLFLFITLLASFALIRAVSPVADLAIAYFSTGDQTFTGVITDTRRIGGPGEAGESDHDARYFLFDGRALYVLSDQRTPERFVARKVRVRGSLRGNGHILDVKAIDPA